MLGTPLSTASLTILRLKGKVERYHQTLKKWLRKLLAASSIDELQTSD